MSKSKPSSSAVRGLLFVVGCTGAGKTTIGRMKVDTEGPRDILAIDRLGTRPTSFSHGFLKTFTDANALLVELRRALDAGENYRLSLARPDSSPNSDWSPKAGGYMARLAKKAAAISGRPVWLVVEEAVAVAQHGVCESDLIDAGIDGRHFGVSMLGLAQFSTGITPPLRRELAAGELWCGRLVDWTDAKNFAGRLGKDHVRRLSSLETVQDNGYARWFRLAEGRAVPEEFILQFRGGRPSLALAQPSAAVPAVEEAS